MVACYAETDSPFKLPILEACDVPLCDPNQGREKCEQVSSTREAELKSGDNRSVGPEAEITIRSPGWFGAFDSDPLDGVEPAQLDSVISLQPGQSF